jgi:hypothetical protein
VALDRSIKLSQAGNKQVAKMGNFFMMEEDEMLIESFVLRTFEFFSG